MPCGESSMWGDYHAVMVALNVQRLIGAGRILPSGEREGASSAQGQASSVWHCL